MDFKEILGDLYTDDIGTKLSESGMKFADLNTGKYVSKEKYDNAITELNSYKQSNTNNSQSEINSQEYESLKTQNENLTKQVSALTNENENYKYSEKVREAKVDEKFSKFVISEVKNGMNDETDFEKSLANFLKDNPQYKKQENVRKVNSSFSMSGNGLKTSSNEIFNNALLDATGRNK